MKAITLNGLSEGFWSLRQQGVNLFAGALFALLLLLVGAPVLMVGLMSLRTGFPGEGGPLTLVNFIQAYSDPGTYEILLNTLLFMTAIAVFEVPAIIGLPARILVLSSLIYTSTNPPTGLPDYGLAGAYGAIMLGAGLLLAYYYVRLVRQGKKYTVITGRGYRPREIVLGRWKWPALAFVMLYLSMEVFIPFLVLVWTSLLPHLKLPSIAALSSITFKNYVTIMDYAGARPFINTAILMFAVPCVTMLLSVLISWVVIRTQVSFRGVLDTMALTLYSRKNVVISTVVWQFWGSGWPWLGQW